MRELAITHAVKEYEVDLANRPADAQLRLTPNVLNGVGCGPCVTMCKRLTRPGTYGDGIKGRVR